MFTRETFHLPAVKLLSRHLFSAFFAALTVAVVFHSPQIGACTAAVYSSLALAFTPLFWKYASIAEVYTLSAACLAFILLFILKWKETHNPRWLFLAGLFGGLSLGVHATVALSGVVFFLYLALSTRQWADWRNAALGTFAGVIIFLSAFLLLDFLNSPAGYYNAVVRPSLSAWDITSADFDSPFERLAFLFYPPQFKGQFFSLSYDEVRAIASKWDLKRGKTSYLEGGSHAEEAIRSD
jgi:4-amino-4-deoxy-L-arabinose transferase-like glycosyltransferase